MPAVANAIYDAVGVRVDEVPVLPEKIFKGLSQLKTKVASRIGPAKVPEIEFPEPIRVERPESMEIHEAN